MSALEFHAPGFQTPEFHTSKAAPRAVFSNGSLFRRVLHTFAWLGQRRRAGRDLDRLMRFSDRELADIGVSRTELLHVARYGSLPEQKSGRRSR